MTLDKTKETLLLVVKISGVSENADWSAQASSGAVRSATAYQRAPTHHRSKRDRSSR